MVKNPRINIGRVLKAVCLIVLAALVVWYVLEGRYWSYLPNIVESESVAAKLVREKRNPADCFKTFQLFFSYPPLAEARFSCVREYAALTKDPSVCELLMPSSYGLSCVGTALGNFESCPLGNNRETEIDGNIVSLKKCIDGNAGVRDSDCCKVAKARFLTGFDDCNISTPGIRDECNYELSFKNNDPSTCASISGAKVKSACEIAAGALQKDPSICVGCIKPVNSPDELGQ